MDLSRTLVGGAVPSREAIAQAIDRAQEVPPDAIAEQPPPPVAAAPQFTAEELAAMVAAKEAERRAAAEERRKRQEVKFALARSRDPAELRRSDFESDEEFADTADMLLWNEGVVVEEKAEAEGKDENDPQVKRANKWRAACHWQFTEWREARKRAVQREAQLLEEYEEDVARGANVGRPQPVPPPALRVRSILLAPPSYWKGDREDDPAPPWPLALDDNLGYSEKELHHSSSARVQVMRAKGGRHERSKAAGVAAARERTPWELRRSDMETDDSFVAAASVLQAARTDENKAAGLSAEEVQRQDAWMTQNIYRPLKDWEKQADGGALPFAVAVFDVPKDWEP